MAEIDAWGFRIIGRRSAPATVLLRLLLFVNIVFRRWDVFVTGPVLAWQIAVVVHPWGDPVREWRRLDAGIANA